MTPEELEDRDDMIWNKIWRDTWNEPRINMLAQITHHVENKVRKQTTVALRSQMRNSLDRQMRTITNDIIDMVIKEVQKQRGEDVTGLGRLW